MFLPWGAWAHMMSDRMMNEPGGLRRHFATTFWRDSSEKIRNAGRRIACAVILFASFPVQAAPLVDTHGGADPRRKSGGAANVTVETAPEADAEGKRDAERVDDSYQPKGIELGQFLLLPLIENEVRYNSNFFAERDKPKADQLFRIGPEMQLRSRFSEHALNITARAEQIWMRRYRDDNQLNGQLYVDGRYDFDRSWEGNGFLDMNHQHEDRGSPDDKGGKKPTPTDSAVLQFGSKARFGKYTVLGNMQVARRTFGDVATSTGTAIRNADRNRFEFLGTVRGAYEIFPGYSMIVQMEGNRRRYDDTFDDDGYNRSSRGWRAEAGVGVDLTQLIRGDFVVGYLSQNYEDARLSDPQGLSFRATFNWTPSRLTVVVPSFERSVQETTSRGSSSIVHTEAAVIVRHELQRNIVLTGTARVSQDRFSGLDRTNWTYEGRGRVIWALAPEYFVGGEASYRKRTSTLASSEYDQYVLMAKFGLRM